MTIREKIMPFLETLTAESDPIKQMEMIETAESLNEEIAEGEGTEELQQKYDDLMKQYRAKFFGSTTKQEEENPNPELDEEPKEEDEEPKSLDDLGFEKNI